MTNTPQMKRRYRSGTAAWHMSKEAVDLSITKIAKMTDMECINYLVIARFGALDTARCNHCGTIGRHYWRVKELRWKCKGCGKTFSVTSGTVFANSRLPYQGLLTAILLWLNSAAGQPATELRRHMNWAYNTAFSLQHKIREGFMRGHNIGLISGDIEMDGAHQSGYRAAEKRGQPQSKQRANANLSAEELTGKILTQTGKLSARKSSMNGGFHPEFGQRLDKNRRINLIVCKRTGKPGKGSSNTRVAVGLAESAPIVTSVVNEYIAFSESYLNTDASPAYTEIGKKFRAHRTVEHSKELSGPNGESNNQVEELNWRYDRAEKGIYLNLEPKYILDYTVEVAFRSDTRRLSNGQQLKLALHIAMNVGESKYWRGFTHGHHREFELTHPTPLPAKASGPAKGKHPMSSKNGIPPR